MTILVDHECNFTLNNFLRKIRDYFILEKEKVLLERFMDLDEFDNYVKDFMETPAEGLTNLKRGESFYLPMVEVVSYLTNNRFKVFVV